MRLAEVYQQDEQNEAIEAIDDLEETVGMLTSQYGSEVAQFGDAWPGADQDIERARAHLEEVRSKLGHFSV